jgi:TolA-binding protein
MTGLLLVAPAFAAESEAAPVTLDFANGLYARRMYETAAAEYERFILENPSSPEIPSARFRLASSFYYLKKHAQAILLFEKFIQDYPKDKRVPAAYFRVGVSRFFLGENDAAAKVFLKTSQYEADPVIRSGSLFYLAKSYEASGRADQALETYQKLTVSFPQSEYASYAALYVGDTLKKKGDLDGAARAYTVAAGKPFPESVSREARFKLGDLYFEQKKFDDAEAAYAGAIKADRPDETLSSRALLALFYCDLSRRDPESALKRLSENADFIEKTPSGAEIYYAVSAFFWDDPKDARAVEYLDRALSHSQLDAETRGKALLKKASLAFVLGRPEEALTLVAQIETGPSGDLGAAYSLKGKILQSAGRLPEASVAYEAALIGPRESPSVREALLNLALLRSQTGENEKARGLFERFVRDYPDSPDAERVWLEWIQLEIDTDHFDAAAELASKFAVTYPKSIWLDIAAYKLGVAHSSAKRFKEAADAFGSIAQNSPDSAVLPEALYAAAACRESLGEDERAARLIETLAERFPKHELTQQALPRLGPLYVAMKDYDKAASFYERALLEGTGGPVSPEAAFWLVQYRLDQGEYAKMRSVLSVFGERYPSGELAHETAFFMGESFMGTSEFEKAIEQYTRSIALKANGPFTPHAYLGMGVAFAARNNPTEAEKNFNEALKFDEETEVGARARYEIASLKLRAGDTLEAAKAFMLVAILFDDPKYSPLSLYKAGECFQKAGKIEDGKKAFEELKSKYPQSEWAKKAV